MNRARISLTYLEVFQLVSNLLTTSSYSLLHVYRALEELHKLLGINHLLVQSTVLPLTGSIYPSCHAQILILIRSHSFARSFGQESFFLILAQHVAPQRPGLETGKESLIFLSQTVSVKISIRSVNIVRIKFLPTKAVIAVPTDLYSLLFLDQRSSLHNSPGPKA